MNILKPCLQGIGCFIQGIYYLFNRLIECCVGKPKAKERLFMAKQMLSDDHIENVPLEKREIFLAPENHYDEKDAHAKDDLIRNVNNYKIVLALEGLERDEFSEKEFRRSLSKFGIKESDPIYGIEDSFFNLFNTALDLNVKINVSKPSKERELNSIILNDLNSIILNDKTDLLCSLINRANQQYLTKFWNQNTLQNNAIYKFLKSNEDELAGKDLGIKISCFRKFCENSTNSQWISLIKELVAIIAPDLKKRLDKKHHDTLEFLLKSMNEKDIIHDKNKFEKFYKALHLDIRNEIIADNEIAIYEMTKDLRRKLISPLGLEHIAGIAKLLENKGIIVKYAEKK